MGDRGKEAKRGGENLEIGCRPGGVRLKTTSEMQGEALHSDTKKQSTKKNR